MDEFGYLSVLLSIVLGLALQQVLQGYRALLLNRARVRLYAPPLIWSALIVLIVAQNWWASFGLSHYHHWGFAAFGVILLEVVLLYMMAGVVLPDLPAGEPVDLREHYHRERRWFFGLFLATLAASLMRDLVLSGHLPGLGNLSFHLILRSNRGDADRPRALSRMARAHHGAGRAQLRRFIIRTAELTATARTFTRRLGKSPQPVIVASS